MKMSLRRFDMTSALRSLAPGVSMMLMLSLQAQSMGISLPELRKKLLLERIEKLDRAIVEWQLERKKVEAELNSKYGVDLPPRAYVASAFSPTAPGNLLFDRFPVRPFV
jgi:hypothetical protein